MALYLQSRYGSSQPSDIPQGSVFGPVLFLAHISDLPEQVKSKVRLFADDTIMYHAGSSPSESKVVKTEPRAMGKDVRYEFDSLQMSGPSCRSSY